MFLRDAKGDQHIQIAVVASCNLAPRKEQNALLPGTNAGPADVLIPHWTGGQDTALDVTVVSPLLPDRVSNSSSTPGHTTPAIWNKRIVMTWTW